MFTLHTSARPLVAFLGTTAALALATGSADAASKTKPKPRADLTVKQLHVDVSDEGTLLVSGDLLNIGRKSARPSDVVIALSDDNRLDEDDDVLDEVGFLRIQAGTRRSIDDEVDIPLDVDTTDGLNILVCADGYDDVVERNESNNCVAQEVVVDDILPADDAGEEDVSDDADETDPTDDGR